MKNISLIFFTILGVSATFMPWLHYPKGNGVIYGYLVDGIVTGFVFLLILVYALLTLKTKKLNSVFPFIVSGLGLLMAVTSYLKIQEIEAEKLSFNTDNPMIAIATAGFHQGIGIYIFGLAGLGVFLTIIFDYIYKVYNSKSKMPNDLSKVKNPFFKIGGFLLIIVVIMIAFFLLFEDRGKAISKDGIRMELTNQVNIMGKALAKGDYTTFVDFNHPLMIQSYGGKEQTVSLLRSTMEELKKTGTTIKDVSLSDIYDMTHDGKNIQAIITMKVTYSGTEQDKNEIQKMIAVSDDGGAKWHFINIDGKNKAEILSFFPDLNQNLKF